MGAQSFILGMNAVRGEAESGDELQDVGPGDLVKGWPHQGIFGVAGGAGIERIYVLLDVVEA